MYLYGASGHAKVIVDILKSQNVSVSGFIDDNEELVSLLGKPVHRSSYIFQLSNESLIISIGNNQVRKRITTSLSGQVNFGTALAQSSIVSDSTQIGEGTVVMQGAIIQAESIIGKHCIINSGASIDHECIIGDFAHISPHATLCGNVHIGEATHIGAGSTVIPGVSIGKNTIIGAGSVVVSNIPDNVVAYGNPCRIIRKLKDC